MKKILFLIIISTVFISCQSKIEGEGPATSVKNYDIENYENLNINCNCDITLIPSDEPRLIVESHENLIENLEVSVKGKNLNIKENSIVSNYDLYNVSVYFTPKINKISLDGNTKMKTSGTLKAEKLNMELKDNSLVDETFVEIRDMSLNITGHAKAEMKGEIINFDIQASKDANGEFFGVRAVDVKFKAENRASLSLYAMKSLSGKAMDDAVVVYKGDPKKDATEKDKAVIQQSKE